MKTDAKFTFDRVRHDQENELHLVVSLEAPKTDWEKERAPLCIMPVIDISGSMKGPALDYAKKSAIKMVEHLSDKDYAGLAVFGSDVELISTPIKMNAANKTRLKSQIGDLYTRGMTNFSGGLLLGLKEVGEADLPEGVIKRVIMLTDGHANQGVATNFHDLSTVLKKNMGSVTVSCFGYGEGADQELLSGLSDIGKGNYAFIQNPDDALSAFAKELGGLLSTYAQNIKVEVEAHNGHQILEVVSDFDANGGDKQVTVKTPEILSEEKMNMVLKMKLSKQSKALPRAMNVCDITISYDRLNEDKELRTHTEELKAKVKFVKPGKEQLKPDCELDKIVANAEIVKVQNECEQLAKDGDFHSPLLMLGELQAAFNSRGLDGMSGFAKKLETKFANAQVYASSQSYLTSAKKGLTRSVGVASVHADYAADADALGISYENSTQKRLRRAFTQDSADVPDAPDTIEDAFKNSLDQNYSNSSLKEVKITSSSIQKSRKRW